MIDQQALKDEINIVRDLIRKASKNNEDLTKLWRRHEVLMLTKSKDQLIAELLQINTRLKEIE